MIATSPPLRSGQLHTSKRAVRTIVELEEAIDRFPPRAVGGPPVDMLRHVPSSHPELGVLDVGDASVFGATGWVIVDGAVVADLSWYGDALTTETLVPTHEVAQVRLPGTTLSLLSEFAAQNYGHLLYDAVPRLDLFERAGGTFDTVDRILCPGPSPLHRLWTDVGVPSDRVVCADPNVIYVVDHLVATSFPGTRRILPRWAARFLRGRLSGPPPARTGRRLYLGRSTSRRLSNEPLLVPHLLDLGFEVIDPGADGVDARAAFAEADVIVGAHGAAFADLVFCRAGTRVLEIVPTDHVYPHWFAASRSCDLDYRFVAADSAAVRPAGTLGPSPHDITVDLGQFMDALHQLIDELGTT